MSGEAIALLIVTGLAFVAAAVWIGYWWNRPLYPAGRKRYEFRAGTWTVTVISNEIDRDDAKMLVDAIEDTIEAWIVQFGEIEDGIDGRRMVAIRVETLDWFRAQQRYDMAAFLHHVAFRWHGWFYPMLVIRKDYLEVARTTGEPVIHEMLHALQKDERDDVDRDHSDPLIWDAAGGTDSVQSKAQQLYLDR